MRPVDIFHVGPQKSGTTWIYHCMKEHPEVACPEKDSIHYFDIFYSCGREWYAGHFRHAQNDQKLFDPTYTYIRSPWAARRIAQENPEAKIVMCMRNPIERAFSHYWHEKKKGKHEFAFAEVLENYDLYASWLEPGFYAEHIERFRRFFPADQILCQLFDQMQAAPDRFIRRLFEFVGVDATFVPSVTHGKINVAGTKKQFGHRILGRALAPLLGSFIPVPTWVSGKAEYVRGIPEDVARALLAVCEPELQRIEQLLGISLEHWRHMDSRN